MTYACVFETPHAAVVTFNGSVGHEPDINYNYWSQQKSSGKTIASSASHISQHGVCAFRPLS